MKVTFQLNEGRVSLIDEEWPLELDVSVEMLAEPSQGLWSLVGDVLTFDLWNASAVYDRVGDVDGVVRFRLAEGHREGSPWKPRAIETGREF